MFTPFEMVATNHQNQTAGVQFMAFPCAFYFRVGFDYVSDQRLVTSSITASPPGYAFETTPPDLIRSKN